MVPTGEMSSGFCSNSSLPPPLCSSCVKPLDAIRSQLINFFHRNLDPLDRVIDRWIEQNEALLKLYRTDGVNGFLLRYEDLIAGRWAELYRASESLGVECDPSAVLSDPDQVGRSFPVREEDRDTLLDAEQIRDILKRVQPLRIELGYAEE